MPEEPEESLGPAVVVLVSEDFFRDRICTTLNAVGHDAVVLAVGEDIVDFQERILQATSLGLVIDLEEEDFDALAVLPALLADDRSNSWTFMAFCSHEKEELIAGAAALGVEVVPRSTFASNLVRLLQGFSAQEDNK
jgi:hypothetical protein